MTEIKILAKYDGTEELNYLRGWENCFLNRFISQETVKENDKEVPKYEILVVYTHPKIKELEKERVSL